MPLFYSEEGDHLFIDFRKLEEKPRNKNDLSDVLEVILTSLSIKGRLFLLRYNRETETLDGFYSNNLSPHQNRKLTQEELNEMEPHLLEFLLKKTFSEEVEHLIDLSYQVLYTRIFEEISLDLSYKEKVFNTYKNRLKKEKTVKEKTVFLSNLSHSLTQKQMDPNVRETLIHRLQLEIYKPRTEEPT